MVCLDVEPRDWMQGYTLLRLAAGRLEPFTPPPHRARVPAPLPLAGARLVLEGVRFGHDPKRPLFTGASLSLPAGALVAVTGPNGAGKSSLMRLIAGLSAPQAGRIRVDGHDPAEAGPEAVGRILGMVPQQADRQFLATRVRDEAAFASRQLRLPDPAGNARQALAALGIEELAEDHPFDLDSGARRLVAVAAAAAHRPKLLILDEAQRGLDGGNTARLERFLEAERARGTLILAVCHDMDFAARNATHVLRVAEGKVSAHEAPSSSPP